jgi:hypothetical protein
MSVNPTLHHNPSREYRPHERSPHYRNVNPNDAEVLRKRAISPKVAAERGTRTAGNRMIIPLWNTQGETGPEQYRPHNPTPNAEGKIAKYLFAPGAKMIVDVHPRSLPTLTQVHTPLIITESALKADAILSDPTLPPACVVSVSGVWNWRSGDMPLSDFRDIPMKVEKREKVIYRRPVPIAFDSDATTKAGPMRGRWELTEYLRRRKAQVLWIDVPDAADGSKQGIDDALAAGHTMEAMLASAYPAPETMPTLPGDEPEGAVDERREAFYKAQWQDAERRARRAEALARAQAAIILNPSYGKVDRPILYNLVTKAIEAIDKQGGDSHQAAVPLEVASNDWRRKGQSGPYNDNGTMIITDRKSAKSIIASFAEEGVIQAELKPVRRVKPGRSWDGWDVVINIDDPIRALDRIAQWVSPAERKKRAANKPVMESVPCASCGEVHSRTQVTMCNGCGAETAPPKVLPPKRVEVSAERSREENFSSKETLNTMEENISPLLPPIPVTPRNRAQAWLFDTLKGGMRPAVDIEHAARDAGLAPDLVRAARHALNVTSRRLPGESRVYWTLPPGAGARAS